MFHGEPLVPTPLPLDSLCDIFRPLGAAAPTYIDVQCRLVPSLRVGRGSISGPTYLMWTHWLDLEPTSDIRDGCVRAAATNYISYHDGDGIRMVIGGETWTFVVVWVERRYPDTDQEYLRAYMVRDVVLW